MLAIAYYIIKVVICSGILYGYYRLALHNKVFHRWNRFYLLGAVAVSLCFPLIKINIWHSPTADSGQVIRLLNVVTTSDELVYEASQNGKFQMTGEQVLALAYVAISFVLLVVLAHTLIKLWRLIQSSPFQKIEDIRFVDSEAEGTPFSFFRNIFWNRSIDIESATGKKIFLHELTHVHENHSVDKLFINIVMIFFWCNPFFWLIRREMNMIHEFIADSKAVKDSDTASFAAMILQAAYPRHTFGLTSSFFSSSIKRRLHMLTKTNHPSINYLSRILALPLLTFVFVAFTVKTKQLLPASNEMNNIALEKNITVVVDAGHGGDDGGAQGPGGLWEKDIALQLARKIKTLNTNNNVNIILTRDQDIKQELSTKVDVGVKQRADAFISLHVNAAIPGSTGKSSGFEIYLSKNQTGYSENARLLGSLISQEIQTTYGTAVLLKQRDGQKGVWVLDAPEINYPALLIECGYITDKNDLAFITREDNQEKIAKDILKAIERFAKVKEGAKEAVIESSTTENGVVRMRASEITIDKLALYNKNELPQLVVLNGREISKKDIKNKRLLNGTATFYAENQPAAIKLFGDKAKNGLIVLEGTLVEKEAKGNTDTLPANIKSVDITTDNKVIVIYKDDRAEKITMTEAQKRGIAPVAKTGIEIRYGKSGVPDSVLYLLDGVEISAADLKKINPADIETMSVIKDKSTTDKYGARAKNGVVEITLKEGVVVGAARPGNVLKVGNPALPDSVLYFLDGVEISADEMKKLVPEKIESMTVLKDKPATDKYGARGKNGVIEITLK